MLKDPIYLACNLQFQIHPVLNSQSKFDEKDHFAIELV